MSKECRIYIWVAEDATLLPRLVFISVFTREIRMDTLSGKSKTRAGSGTAIHYKLRTSREFENWTKQRGPEYCSQNLMIISMKNKSFTPIAAQLRRSNWCKIKYSIFVSTLKNHFERRECQEIVKLFLELSVRSWSLLIILLELINVETGCTNTQQWQRVFFGKNSIQQFCSHPLQIKQLFYFFILPFVRIFPHKYLFSEEDTII